MFSSLVVRASDGDTNGTDPLDNTVDPGACRQEPDCRARTAASAARLDPEDDRNREDAVALAQARQVWQGAERKE